MSRKKEPATETPERAPLPPRVIAEGCSAACEHRNMVDVRVLVMNWDAKWQTPNPGQRYAAMNLCARHRAELDAKIADERRRLAESPRS